MRPLGKKERRQIERVQAARAAGRATLREQRQEYAARRPHHLGGVLPLIERLHPWDFARLPYADWRNNMARGLVR